MAVVAATLFAVIIGLLPTAAHASDAVDGFDPGNIISDEVFFASTTMTADEVQSFLDAKVPECVTGYVCLKDFAQATNDRPADAMCTSDYTGHDRETAAEIIANVAQACGINPQVLLVLLQKEQGLVTHVWPSDWRYRIAMGQGCPDTAECDAQFFGFFNQVYSSAWQFKRYANPEGTRRVFTWYAPGNTWNVRYSPDATCGTAPVYVENQATANLYYYTPYQPNQASLAGGYGTGDACSSYGNRNFVNYFTGWFGSTRSYSERGAEAIATAAAGVSDTLGGATTDVVCGLLDNGCYQGYAGGELHWSSDSGAYATQGPILAAWAAGGWENGTLGYPTGAQQCDDAGRCIQPFQGGEIAWTAAEGAYVAAS